MLHKCCVCHTLTPQLLNSISNFNKIWKQQIRCIKSFYKVIDTANCIGETRLTPPLKESRQNLAVSHFGLWSASYCLSAKPQLTSPSVVFLSLLGCFSGMGRKWVRSWEQSAQSQKNSWLNYNINFHILKVKPEVSMQFKTDHVLSDLIE